MTDDALATARALAISEEPVLVDPRTLRDLLARIDALPQWTGSPGLEQRILRHLDGSVDYSLEDEIMAACNHEPRYQMLVCTLCGKELPAPSPDLGPASQTEALSRALDNLGGMWSWNDAYLDDQANAHLWITQAGRILRHLVGRPAQRPGSAVVVEPTFGQRMDSLMSDLGRVPPIETPGDAATQSGSD